MNVVLVGTGPANGAERDLVSRRQVSLLTALRTRGVTASVVLLGDEGGLRPHLEAAAIGVDVIPTTLAPNGSSLARLPLAVARLRPVLRRFTPDIIEGDEPLPAIAVGLAVFGRRPPVVLYRRHHQSGRRRLLAASRLAARLTDRTIVSSDAMRHEAARQDRVSPERIEVASSGAADLPSPPAPDVAALRRRLGIPEDARVVGAVSRLRREKGLDVLIRCLDLVGVGPLHLVIVGDGPEDSTLRGLAAESRVPVHFAGHQEEIAPWLAIADVIALPSRREAFGRVTIEAMAAGRAVAASNVGGLAEAVVDGETGLLVPPDDPPALADRIVTLMSDAELAARLGRAARDEARTRYSFDRMVAAFERIYLSQLTRQGLLASERPRLAAS
jgi:glycosyltransferase involved in cell wall biosynthesis